MNTNNKNKDKNKSRAVLKNVYGYFLPTAWRRHKGYFFVMTGKLITTALRPFIGIIFTPKIIGELLGNRDVSMLIKYAVFLVVLEYICGLLSDTFGNLVERYTVKFENYYKSVISRKIMELDFQLTENKKALDQMELAKNGMGWYSGGLNGIVEPLFSMISYIVMLAGVVLIVAPQAPLLIPVLAILVAASYRLNKKINGIEQESYAGLSKTNRIFGYFAWELMDFRYGKDIRLYGADGMMMGKWNHLIKEYFNTWNGMIYKMLPLRVLNDFTINVLRDIATYFYLGFLAITQRITIPVMTQLVTAAGTFYQSIAGITENLQNIIKRANYANEFVKFMEYPDAIQKGDRAVRDGAHVIEFKNVTFSYPGSDAPVLKGINLTIDAGTHLSVVGLNGAGKTTFIKLLCRLYDPDEGEILMDGINIKEYNYSQYMSVFAPVFQDFKLFSFSAKENLTLEEETSEEEETAITEIAKQTGIYDKFAALKNGLDSILFKYFDDEGIEPSGGEQQKLAIARALYKNAPIVILDEPTAALDPIAEYEIYCQFEEMVKGKTAIYISHRLSSCQFCDSIAVFSGGSVAEYGTHAELVKRQGGIYAQMFAAQAQYYV
ncbi:MAG: ABC transporter ATP-binding protein/permease [Muribaculum sp.]|nr:ABC transporter ATP-binding protein/permease [Muribaculum sp.]